MTVTAFSLGLTTAPGGAVSLLTLATLSAPQGGTITISGNVSSSSTCPANAPVQLTSTSATGGTNLFPNGMGPQVPRDANGGFQASFVIPAATPVGSYTIGFTCGGTVVGSTDVVTVTAAVTKASVTVAPASAQPGASVTVSGAVPTAGTVSCPSGDAAQLTSVAALFPPDGFGPMAPRDSNGNFHVAYTIPSATPAGKYAIGLRCGGANAGVATSLQVVASTTTTTAPTTTTTTTAGTTTTTSSAATSTTAASATTTTTMVAVPTTAAPVKAKGTADKSSLRWLALGALALLVLAATVVFLGQRRRTQA